MSNDDSMPYLEQYKLRQADIIKKQQTCWGFHAPELKKHALCDDCMLQIFPWIAQTERDRAAGFIESLGYADLAKLVRALP